MALEKFTESEKKKVDWHFKKIGRLFAKEENVCYLMPKSSSKKVVEGVLREIKDTFRWGDCSGQFKIFHKVDGIYFPSYDKKEHYIVIE